MHLLTALLLRSRVKSSSAISTQPSDCTANTLLVLASFPAPALAPAVSCFLQVYSNIFRRQTLCGSMCDAQCSQVFERLRRVFECVVLELAQQLLAFVQRRTVRLQPKHRNDVTMYADCGRT